MGATAKGAHSGEHLSALAVWKERLAMHSVLGGVAGAKRLVVNSAPQRVRRIGTGGAVGCYVQPLVARDGGGELALHCAAI